MDSSGARAQLFKIKAVHVAERLRLKDLRERFSQPPIEFSNYEMVFKYSETSFLFIYNYGSAVFFNVPDDVAERELSSIQEYKMPSEFVRATDLFLLEVQETPPGTAPSRARVFFDRIVVAE